MSERIDDLIELPPDVVGNFAGSVLLHESVCVDTFSVDVAEGRTAPRSTFAERHPEFPNVSLRFLFSPHGNVEDGSLLQDGLKDVDLYFFESHPPNPKVIGFLQAAANDRRRLSPSQLDGFIDGLHLNGIPVRGRFLESQVRALRGTGIQVATCDVGYRGDESIVAESRKAFAEWPPFPMYPSLHGQIADCLANAHAINRACQVRDTIIMGNASHPDMPDRAGRFEHMLTGILQTTPLLAEKARTSGLQVGMGMGAAHEYLYGRAFSAGIPVEKIISARPSSFTHVARTQLLANRIPDETLMAKVFLETLVLWEYGEVRPGPTSGVCLDAYAQKILANFDISDIAELHRALYEKTVKESGGVYVPGIAREILDYYLSKKGQRPLVWTNVQLMAELAEA